MTHNTNNANLASPQLLIQHLDRERIWVAWQKALGYPSDEKPRKIPYDPNSTWAWAKADDPSTWGIRDEAEARARQLPMPYSIGGLGIELSQLSDSTFLCGIDLDSCRDPETWEIAEWAEQIQKAFDSYTEVSPSETGVKIFFRIAGADMPALQEAFGRAYDGKQKYGAMFKRATGKDHPPAIELHIGHRFFALTERMLVHSTLELRIVPLETVLELLTVTGPEFAGTDRRIFSQKDVAPLQSNGNQASTGDNSRSAKALRLAIKRVAGGDDESAVYAALAADPATGEWLRTKGDANGGREWKRTYAAAVAKIESQKAEAEFEPLEPMP